MPEERIGLMGGSFDPVHHGHLIAAQDALEGLELDRVIFVPASRSPLKNHSPESSDEDRLAMLRAAIQSENRFAVSTLEIARGGVSYSIDTVEEQALLHPGARLFWILGADQAAALQHWHRAADLFRMVEFIILARPGFSWDPAGLPNEARVHPIESHTFSVSSSELRERIRQGRSIRFLLPERVASLIKTRHLYRR